MFWMNQGYNPYTPFGNQFQMMNMRQQPVPQSFPSVVDRLANRPAYQTNAPSLAELFPGLASPQSYSYEQSYQQPSQSSGAGRFTGLLGGK